MLHLVDSGTPHDPSYRVPFTVDRSGAPRFTLVNRGSERLRGISLTLLGDGRMLWGLPSVLEPGDGLVFVVHGDEIERNCVVLVRWFRPSGDEYLWRVSF